ncbi:MAG TPA: hypothetical protein VGR62_01705 [Candidatus Binatia bacterium]|jgi:hypothetical protein|nr:hypothetical protein [Candidatus Binatia bacterium]
MRFPTRVAFLLGLLLSLMPVARAAALCGNGQLCDPGAGVCEITAGCTIASGTGAGVIFDLGARPFVIRAGKTLTVTGTGGITIYASTIELENGAKIVATGGPGNAGASVALESPGNVTLRVDTVIDVSAQPGGGSIGLRSGGAISAMGSLQASSAGGAGSGGNIDIDTFLDNGGNIEIGGTGINTTGGPMDSGGFVDINANLALTIGGPITSRGGSFDGGSVTLAALGGSLSLLPAVGAITTSSNGAGGYGGDVDLYAAGALSIGAPIAAKGAGGGGNGASIDLVADTGNLTIGARLDAGGGPGGGYGGDVTATAGGTISISGVIAAPSGGTAASGGTIDISATGFISAFESMDVTGGDGGTISIVSDGAVTVASALTATGTATMPIAGLGGNVELQGCDVTVAAAGALVSTGDGPFPFAANAIEASGAMTILGTLTAGAVSHNQLIYRSQAPVFNPAKVTPGVTDVHQSDALPCCIACQPTTTTSSSTTTTSTSTTVTSTTTSSTVSTTSTSSTTMLTTTSSLVPTTTSTSVSTTTSSSTSSTSTSSTTSTSVASTTSTSVTTTTSTTATSTTSSSVTSTTSTTSVPTTTSTSTTIVVPSTTTTIVVPTTTTTTTLPLTCMDLPLQGYDAVDCRLGTLADTLAVQEPTTLGGTRVARQLTAKVSKARKLVTTARRAKKAAAVLKRADRQLRSFDRVVDKTAQKGKLPADLRLRLLDLSRATSAEIGVLRAS